MPRLGELGEVSTAEASRRQEELLREVRLPGEMSPRLLRKLLPKEDLHSVVVCGSHSFKASVAGMYRKVGVPLSSITTL
jgi:ferredoxin-NADP reductase